VLPWSARNAKVHGAFVLVDTNGPYNFLVGTEPSAFQVDKDDRWNPYWATHGKARYAVAVERAPGQVQRVAIKRAWRRIAQAPGHFMRKSLWEASHLFTLDNFVLRHLRNGWYGGASPPGLSAMLTLVCAGFSALLLAAGGVALVALPASPFRGFSALVVLHATLLFGLTYSLSRYAVPLRPLLAIAAAWLLLNPQAARSRIRGARAWLCAGILLWLAASWWRDLPLLADMLVSGGAQHRFLMGAAR
jgi:hypothetical protein